MTLRCKPGDLAIVLHDTAACAENIGRIVQLRGPVQTNSAGMQTWLIRPVNGTLYCVGEGAGCSREVVDWNSGVRHEDAWLLPMRHLVSGEAIDGPVEAVPDGRDPGARTPAQGRLPDPVPVSSLHYRPRSYFGEFDLEAHLLTRVKGHMRRKRLREFIAAGRVADLPDFLTQTALDEEDRQLAGRFHPQWMGGEYLPSVRAKEVEIARIGIESTTHDVTCVYARRSAGRIRYRVVDEYGGETLQRPSTRTSSRPLALGELLDFFLGAWDLRACLEGNFDDDLAGMLRFFEGESEFYPAFHSALEARVIEWFAPQGSAAS